MGTDIHGVFQRHDSQQTGKWEDIPHKYEMGRHYQLFAVLAGVRNGTGFAGVRTGEPVSPISAPRGYPEGFVVTHDDDHPIVSMDVMDPRRRSYCEPDEVADSIWMGDHSHSWLTADEMLSWYANAPTVIQTGVLSRAEYEQWHKTSRPKSYSGGIWGQGVVVIDDNDAARATDDWTHIRCAWQQSLTKELAYFFDEVRRLADEYGQVRFVFGFDS